jgi:pimeloyl-ACP methyl ester carboxylesterase
MKCFFLLSLLVALGRVESFLSHHIRRPSSSLSVSLSLPTLISAERVESSTEIRKYEYDGWNLTYRYKAASPGYENASPILLIHPVGIGLSSWFWEQFMAEWTGPAVYAPNLIGCGISEGGDAWDPDERGLSFPLGWAQGCEALMKSLGSGSSPLSGSSLIATDKNRKWTVMSQGGLAPVAVMMAARNPDMIDNLVLASPPTWKDMTTAVPEVELSRNYNFLRNPVWGRFAFKLLESRGAIEFFSNQFLFSDPCDPAWLDKAEHELGLKARPPVVCFNAGFCQHRSFEEELQTLPQSTLILAGHGDKRQREEYTSYMKDCRLQVLPGLNVLPWESPSETVQALKRFL